MEVCVLLAGHALAGRTGALWSAAAAEAVAAADAALSGATTPAGRRWMATQEGALSPPSAPAVVASTSPLSAGQRLQY